jgi:hypothetical protein
MMNWEALDATKEHRRRNAGRIWVVRLESDLVEPLRNKELYIIDVSSI